MNFNKLSLNVLIDTGASCSLIDMGSIQKLALNSHIKPSLNHVIDASGNKMNITGLVDIHITAPGVNTMQNMKIIETNS